MTLTFPLIEEHLRTRGAFTNSPPLLRAHLAYGFLLQLILFQASGEKSTVE